MRIGVLYPRSGPWVETGGHCAAAVVAALEDARAASKGQSLRNLELMHGDAADGPVARREAERLIAAGAEVLIGTMFSAAALEASAVANASGVFYVETVAAASEITTRGHQTLIRFNTTSTEYGRCAAQLALRLCGPAARVAIARLDDPFCASFSAGALRESRTLGLTVTADAEQVFTREPASIERSVERIGASRPDAALLVGFDDALPTLLRASDIHLTSARALIGNGSWSTMLAASRVYAIETPGADEAPAWLSPAGSAQRSAWLGRRAALGGDVRVDADIGYAAASIFFEHVLALSGSSEASALRAAAREVDVPTGGTLVGYGARFDDRGDNTRAFPVALRWERGAARVVFPEAERLQAAAPMRDHAKG